MGKGGRGGGGGGGSNPIFRSRLFRALKLGGPSLYSRDVLQKVAMNRGLSVDELLVQLGKQDYEISVVEGTDLMIDEFGIDYVVDESFRKHYSGRKGRENCEYTLQRYNELVKEYGADDITSKIRFETLTKYCSYLIKEEK